MCQPGIKSCELLLHVGQEYDYRYTVKDADLRLVIVDTIRQLINQQVLSGKRSEQCKIYQVDRANLKIYSTLKTEASVGRQRRPGDEFLVDDKKFQQQVLECKVDNLHIENDEEESKGVDLDPEKFFAE